MIIWMTGLSGAGKTTLAFSLSSFLKAKGVNTVVLDGDDLRKYVTNDLGFSREDRRKNARRTAFISRLFSGLGITPIVAVISPYEEDRVMVRDILKDDTPFFIYIKCSVEECERRDPKGLYKKARAGNLPEFTGISAPFEEPKEAELTIDTELTSITEAVSMIYEKISKICFK